MIYHLSEGTNETCLSDLWSTDLAQKIYEDI